MTWLRDSLVDRLIAKNAARPRPGMDKPDLRVVALPRLDLEKAKDPGTLASTATQPDLVKTAPQSAGSMTRTPASRGPWPARDAPSVKT